jgi:hypothetical protein
MKKIFGQSWKTTLAGFFSAAGLAMTQSGNNTVSTIGVVLSVVSTLILGKQAGDSTQVKEVKKDVQEIKYDNDLK